MIKFAKVLDGKVLEVIVAEPDFFNTFIDSSPGNWIQVTTDDGETPIRKHIPGVGDTYNTELDAFYQPKPYPSWKLNPKTCEWEAPKPKPDKQNKWQWNESKKNWDWVKKYQVP